MKKLLSLIAVLGVAFAFTVSAHAEDSCTHSQGYWKKYLADESNEDVITEHTNEDLLAILNQPAKGDEKVILSYQFVAAALNKIECDMNKTVQDAFDSAYNYLHGDSPKADRDEVLEWKDILEFWNTGERATLESAYYSGTCGYFGNAIGDTLVLTFSNDIYSDGSNIEVYFSDGIQKISQEWAKTDWEIQDNVLTVTTTAIYSNPRDILGREITLINGLVDFIDNPVNLPDGTLVEEGSLSYTTEWSGTFNQSRAWRQGEWEYDISISRECDGDLISGEITMVDPSLDTIKADVDDVKDNYPYWYNMYPSVSRPNLAAVGTATYSGVDFVGNFMFLLADTHLQMILNDEVYQTPWDSGTVWMTGRDYDIWSNDGGFWN